MSARIKCIARKVLHALNIYGQQLAVAKGIMYASDVDHSKVVCPVIVKSDDDGNR